MTATVLPMKAPPRGAAGARRDPGRVLRAATPPARDRPASGLPPARWLAPATPLTAEASR
jgi:hypothetical protein